jgi:hypothetical protein
MIIWRRKKTTRESGWELSGLNINICYTKTISLFTFFLSYISLRNGQKFDIVLNLAAQESNLEAEYKTKMWTRDPFFIDSCIRKEIATRKRFRS